MAESGKVLFRNHLGSIVKFLIVSLLDRRFLRLTYGAYAEVRFGIYYA